MSHKLFLVLIIILFFGQKSFAQRVQSEYETKATFVVHFLEFSEFDSHLVDQQKGRVCIYKDESLLWHFQVINRKSSHYGTVSVQVIQSFSEVPSCQAVFVPASVEREYFAQSKGAIVPDVLSVGETSRFLKEGGAISFYLVGDRVRFEIQTENAKKAHLKMGAKLLKLARISN